MGDIISSQIRYISCIKRIRYSKNKKKKWILPLMITRKKCDSYNEIMAGLMTRFVYLLDERRLIVFTNVSTTRRTCLILFEPFHDMKEVTSMRTFPAPYVQSSDDQVT